MKHDYWVIRSARYNKLKWVKDKFLLNSLIHFSELQSTDVVMEAGCGTGVISKAIAPLVRQVVASDFSTDMLAKMNVDKKIITVCQDLEEFTPFVKCFDKIIARMVFHHFNALPAAFSNCYKMLKDDGALIIQEGGVIPQQYKDVRKWYAKMIALKEKRNNFTTEELTQYFLQAGFNSVQNKIVTDEDFSINNWLANSGQKGISSKIYKLHLNAPNVVKEYYKMRISKSGEIRINSQVVLIKGAKV